MAIVNLLAAYPNANNLACISDRLSEAFGGLQLEERESSNYIGGQYYFGRMGAVEIVVALSDESDHDDLPYWIVLSSNEATDGELVVFADAVTRDKLIPIGFSVARFISFGRKEEQRIDY